MRPRESWQSRGCLGALAILLGGLCHGRAAWAATVYVRASGDDTNDGFSAATAVRTITHAAALAHAGDRVLVGPGTYAEGNISPAAFGHVTFVADRRGVEVSDPPGDAVIDATTFDAGFELNHNLATTIDGFVIYGAGIGIYVKSWSDQAVIRNNIVSTAETTVSISRIRRTSPCSIISSTTTPARGS